MTLLPLLFRFRTPSAAGPHPAEAAPGPERERKRRARRRALLFLLAALAAPVACLAAANAVVLLAGSRHIVARQDARKADAVIVLGALVWSGGEPSQVLLDRLDAGCELYRAGRAPKILVSGDHGTAGYDEANGMRRYLEGRGVPAADIFMDHAGFDTYSTMYRARDVFRVKSALVVTQRYHLYRAVYLANRLGIAAQGVAGDRYRLPNQAWYDLREALARVKAVLQAEILQPSPRFLGPAIPIGGNGTATHDGSRP